MKEENTKLHTLTYIATAIVILFAVNIISNALFHNVKLDFTEGNLYTLSDGSKNVLEKLEEPITLRFFFSNKMATGFPSVKTFAARIKGMLEEFENNSSGNITLKLIDPEPFSDNEDLAMSYGLKGAEIDMSGQKLYFGLSASNSVDETQTIPFFHFDREKFLEYDIARMIYDLSQTKRTTIGLVSTVPLEVPRIDQMVNFQGRKSWAILEQIRQLFNVEIIDPIAEKLPKNIDVLMLVQPKELNEKLLYAIDQFVVKGGKTLLFIDPRLEGVPGNTENANAVDSFKKLLTAWGVDVSSEQVVTDRKAAIRVNAMRSGEQNIGSMVSSLRFNTENFDENDVLTNQLKLITMRSAGKISEHKNGTTKLIPIIKSDKKSSLLNVKDLAISTSVKDLINKMQPSNEALTVVGRVSGHTKSAFENKATEDHINESKEGINLIVVSDVDMLRDQLWVRSENMMGYNVMLPFSDNGSLIINMLDLLSGSKDLIALRGRGSSARPFEVVEDIRRNAEERYLKKEQELQQELANTERRLYALQNQKGGSKIMLSDQEQLEVERFRQEVVRIRKELRGVRHELQKDIERLGTVLKVINIGLMPVCITIFAIILLIYKAGRRARGRVNG